MRRELCKPSGARNMSRTWSVFVLLVRRLNLLTFASLSCSSGGPVSRVIRLPDPTESSL